MNESREARSEYNIMPIKLRYYVLLMLVCFGPDHGSADCGELDLQSILERSAIYPPGAVSFREERHNPMLKEPLVLTGTLEYLEPGVLRKTVDSPFQETYLVEPDRVTVERGQSVEVLRAGQGRLIAAFLGGIEALLAGDFERLTESFEVCAQGNAQAWELNLTPRSRRMARHLEGLQVDGTSETIQNIRINLDDQEWHSIEILHAAEANED